VNFLDGKSSMKTKFSQSLIEDNARKDFDNAEDIQEDLPISEAIQQSLNISGRQNDEGRQQVIKRAKSTAGTILDPIYIPTPSGNETWALTWPIWHMLPHSERKQIAVENGFRTIGDFEEEVILSRALREEGSVSTERLQPYVNADLYELESRPERFDLPIVDERGPPVGVNGDDKRIASEEDAASTDEDSNEGEDQQHFFENENQDEGDIEDGGLILLLPDELTMHNIFSYLSIEYFARCALVSSLWKNFTRSELAYKEMCKRSYLNQSKRKALHVARFGGSYRSMIENRCRVKAGCGVYVLKCTKIKKIQRDMWTEIPFGAICESTYYRYLNFYEDGRVLYALTSKPPHEVIPTFLKVKSTNTQVKSTVFGKYEIQKDLVTVDIEHPWHHVKLFLRVLKDGYIGARGRFWALSFEKHLSSGSNNFDEYWSRDLVQHEVPNEPFRYLRDWRL